VYECRENAHEEFVELLLYLTDGIELDLEINGEPIWRRGNQSEGKRRRLQARLQPGDNLFTVHAQRRAGCGFGFCLGIREQLAWNQQRQGRDMWAA
jgi:hypothetical protein